MLPVFQETVEELFVRGLVKAVFATETLALGINMPARTVVLERLVKFNGEQHCRLTPGEYTQLTGRAGRRGIDVEGHAVVLWPPGVDPRQVAGLASTRTFPLRSSFRPSYNMAVNLVSQMGPAQARELLEPSFAQFQADRCGGRAGPAGPPQREALDELRRRRCGATSATSPSTPAACRVSERETRPVRAGVPQRRPPRRSPWSGCAAATSSHHPRAPRRAGRGAGPGEHDGDDPRPWC